MRELTDKTHVLVTRSLGRFYITEAQATKLMTVLQGDSKMVMIDKAMVMTNDITGIVSGDQIEQIERIRRGDWQCKFNKWHIRGQQCAHNGTN